MSAAIRPMDYSVAKLVEKQMRNWELARAQRDEGHSPQRRSVHEFVAISRRAGSGGAEVASMLGEKLGWPIFDRELLHAMAGNDAIRERLYQSMDERDLTWLEEMLRSLVDPAFPRNDYFHRLTETVLSIARQGSAIFLGRATDLILPKDVGLRVRITAPMEFCVERLSAQRGCGSEDSRAEVLRTERERAQFIENHFDIDARDECRYDLVINIERFSTKDVVGLILSALSIRGVLP